MNIFHQMTFEYIVQTGIALVVIFSALFSILFVIWWGFLMIISGWNEEKIKPAVNHIRHAGIGILFLLWVLYIFPVFMKLAGLQFADYAEPKAIYQAIQNIFDTVFWTQVGTLNTNPTDPNALPSNFSTDF